MNRMAQSLLLTLLTPTLALACPSVPEPRYRIENMSGCNNQRFETIDQSSPASHFGQCTVVSPDGITLVDRVESGVAGGVRGPFADLDVEVAAVLGTATGQVTSEYTITVRRTNPLVAWVDVPVRYRYNLEARADSLGPLSDTGRMTALIGGFIPSASVEACAQRPRPGRMHCDPGGTQSVSESGEGLILFNRPGQTATVVAQAFGFINSFNTEGERAPGNRVGGTAVADLVVDIDPSFAFGSAFRVEVSDGTCIFGGDEDGGFEEPVE
ncbi:MAG: hypothetical protein AAGE01_02960 [Pseudomonadota bacterium]